VQHPQPSRCWQDPPAGGGPHGIGDPQDSYSIGGIHLQVLGPGYEDGVHCRGSQNPPPKGPHGISGPPVAGPHGANHVGGGGRA
jgi:hypothetical protein